MNRITALITAAMVAGCAPTTASDSPEGPREPGQPAGSEGSVMVTVENHRPQTMRIFANRSDMRFLIGEVPPRSERSFRLPPIILEGQGALRLEADPRGSTLTQESDPVNLRNGRVVAWRLRAGGGDRVWVQ